MAKIQSRISLLLLVAALVGCSAQAAPLTDVDDPGTLRRQIWSSCPAPSAHQTPEEGKAAVAACDLRRAPIFERLARLGATAPATSIRIEALALLMEWSPPPAARSALDVLISTYRDDDRLAPALETAYGASRASGKRLLLETLQERTRSRTVAGAGLYLLASEALDRPAVPRALRDAAFAQLRKVRSAYGDLPTKLLGGGDPPMLGRVASAELFRKERLVPGRPLPSMAVRDVEGRPVSSASFGGKVVLIDFWATWCPPCVAATPTLRQLEERYGDRRFEIVSISADDDPTAAKTFAARADNRWPQWHVGPSGVVSTEWTNSSYPYYILIGADGRIVAAGQQVSDVAAALAKVMTPRSR